MPQVELSAGVVEYEDSGGDGPVLVLLAGLLMDARVWDPLVELLRGDHRLVVPTLPLGAHRRPMRADADLSLVGHGRIVAELLDGLDLRDVTLVQNDHAAALVVAGGRPERVARLVITPCEAFENYPPGLAGKNVRVLGFLPGGLYFAAQAMRVGVLRRSRLGFGALAKRPLPEELLDLWLRPMQTQRGVRRDVRRYVTAARRRQMLEVCERIRRFDRPALVVWAPEDRVQRPEHGRRLADILPDARLVELGDSGTLVMRDQPDRLAEEIRAFVAATAPSAV